MESNLNHIFELQYALDTFYFLICGALVMWMAAGFAMLEAGLVRAKNTTEILTKNVALFAVACTMYLIVGYDIMYDGGIFLSGVTTVAEMDDAAIAGVIAASTEAGFAEMGEYSGASDFFFQVVFVATAMSIVSGAVAERMKLWAFLAFAVVMCGFIYPMQGSWTWNGDAVFGMYELSYSDYAGSGIVHMAGAAAALAGHLAIAGAQIGLAGLVAENENAMLRTNHRIGYFGIGDQNVGNFFGEVDDHGTPDPDAQETFGHPLPGGNMHLFGKAVSGPRSVKAEQAGRKQRQDQNGRPHHGCAAPPCFSVRCIEIIRHCAPA